MSDNNMQNWEGAYLELSELIEAELPEIKHIDLFAEQPMAASEGGEYPYPEPAIFIDINTAQDNEVGNDVLQGDTIVTFWVQLSSLADSHRGSVNRTESLEILRLLQRLHKVIHGKSGNHYSALTRVATRREQALPMTHLYAVDYRCIITDYSGQEQHQGVEFDELGVIKGPVEIAGPDENPLFDLDDTYDPATDTGGAPVPEPTVPDPGTVVLKNHTGAEMRQVSVPSGGSVNETIEGSAVVINNEDLGTTPAEDITEVSVIDTAGNAALFVAQYLAGIYRIIVTNYRVFINGVVAGSFLQTIAPNILLRDGSGNEVDPVSVTQDGDEITVVVPEVVSEPYPTVRLSQSPNDSEQSPQRIAMATGASGDHLTDTVHYYGHNYRFCTKIGYTDGVDYFLHDGTPSDKATVFAVGYAIDMRTWKPTGNKATATKLTMEDSDTGGTHNSNANAHVFAGIGPNEWFMWDMQIYAQLTTNKRNETNHLDYAPFDLVYGSGSGNFIFLNNPSGVTDLHFLRVNPYDNTISRGGNSSAHPTFFCCELKLDEI